jgi:hypothetical protein
VLAPYCEDDDLSLQFLTKNNAPMMPTFGHSAIRAVGRLGVSIASATPLWKRLLLAGLFMLYLREFTQ